MVRTTDEILALKWRAELEKYRGAEGMAVRYRSPHSGTTEYGRVVGIDHKYVHVVYGGDGKPTPTCPVNLVPVDRLRG